MGLAAAIGAAILPEALASTAFLGTTVGTALGGGILGLGVGAAESALTGGNIGLGTLFGGLTGGLVPAIGPEVGGALNIGSTAGTALTGAALGAGSSALQGGNPLFGALSGAAGPLLGSAVGDAFGTTPSTGTTGGGNFGGGADASSGGALTTPTTSPTAAPMVTSGPAPISGAGPGAAGAAAPASVPLSDPASSGLLDLSGTSSYTGPGAGSTGFSDLGLGGATPAYGGAPGALTSGAGGNFGSGANLGLTTTAGGGTPAASTGALADSLGPGLGSGSDYTLLSSSPGQTDTPGLSPTAGGGGYGGGGDLTSGAASSAGSTGATSEGTGMPSTVDQYFNTLAGNLPSNVNTNYLGTGLSAGDVSAVSPNPAVATSAYNAAGGAPSSGLFGNLFGSGGSASGSSLGSLLSSPGLLVGGGLLGLNALLQPSVPSVGSSIGPLSTAAKGLAGVGTALTAPAIASLNSEAQGFSTQGTQLENYLTTGTLPPAVQAALNQGDHQAKAAALSRYANMGGGAETSSAAAQDIANISQGTQAKGADIALNLFTQGANEQQYAAQIADKLLASGLGATGQSAALYNDLLNTTLKSDQALGSSIASFAAAMVPKTVIQQPGSTANTAT